MTAIHLVATCSKAKQLQAPSRLQLRSLPARGADDCRAQAWLRRLQEVTGAATPACQLYRGDHWSCVQSIHRELQPRGGCVWVCSAGYGLVSFDAPLHCYDATFTPGQANSVAAPGQLVTPIVTAWWQTLAQWEGPCPGQPRTLTELVERHPGDFFLVAVSEPYLRALAADLMSAVERLASPDDLALLCAGGDDCPALAAFRLPCDARLQSLVGGALTSLNVRLARRALQELSPEEWSLASLRQCFAQWCRNCPSRPPRGRTPLSDQRLRQFIRRELAAAPRARASSLLHRLRDRDLACEQKRFFRLFREVLEANDAR